MADKDQHAEASDAPVVVRDLAGRFGGKTALAGVSLTVPRGVVFGLVGENGAGKTTLIKHILGLLRAQIGEVRVFGMDPVAKPRETLARLGYLSEQRDLPDWMRVQALAEHCRAFYPGWDPAYAAELIALFELDPAARIRTLSRGQRAKAGLMAALAHRPELLLLDEPSSGLDPVVRRDILSAVIRTVADEGRTVLFSSHLLDEVERVADIVAMIHHGKVLLCEPLDALKERHRAVVVGFPNPLDAPPAIDDVIAWQGSGREWTALCNGRPDAFRAALTAAGGEVISETTPTLEDIFVAHVQAGRIARKEE